MLSVPLLIASTCALTLCPRWVTGYHLAPAQHRAAVVMQGGPRPSKGESPAQAAARVKRYNKWVKRMEAQAQSGIVSPPAPPPAPKPPSSMKIMEQLRSASTSELVLRFIDVPSEALNAEHAAACWIRLSRLVSGYHGARERRWLRSNAAAVQPLLELTRRQLPQMEPRALAKTAYGMGKSGVARGEAWRPLWQEIAGEAEAKVARFDAENLANTVWAFATAREVAPALFAAVASEADAKVADFSAQNLANTVWAFATAREAAPALFAGVASEVEVRLDEFLPQALANTAWAYAMAREPAPPMLQPISVLDLIEAGGEPADVMYYRMSMQGLAARGELDAGFALLERAEKQVGHLSSSDGPRSPSVGERDERDCYPIYRILLDACRASNDGERAAQLQLRIERLGLKAIAPEATATVNGEERTYTLSDDGMVESRQLFARTLRRTAYAPLLRSVPFGVRPEKRELSLQRHVEKKALADLLANDGGGAEGQPMGELHISVSLAACDDCHEYFKAVSLMSGRTICLREPRMVHTFSDGQCSCV